MRVSVCIPEGLVRASADLARRLGMTRGALYTRAIAEYLDNHQGDAYVNPLIRAHVEPVLVEEMERIPGPIAEPVSEPVPEPLSEPQVVLAGQDLARPGAPGNHAQP